MTTDHNIVLLDTWIEKAKAARLDASERADLKAFEAAEKDISNYEAMKSNYLVQLQNAE
ncbi:hypothetical protein [Kingella negevensis]|jgi:hypothetical protein|nr:hypothetical protein [Kingella negevensis]MDK4680149.1 hypothetical protein [Kingella negevensis]MDK4685568.1 hypothetical protein [Kingella negevensis]MDK4692326.1 hypothetical protein [Kingella negevensis]MDK4696467.1 hypothetical protein [Kingella negevensis]MDK4698628.1 hypothetical protein [Kingella negevensis]